MKAYMAIINKIAGLKKDFLINEPSTYKGRSLFVIM